MRNETPYFKYDIPFTERVSTSEATRIKIKNFPPWLQAPLKIKVGKYRGSQSVRTDNK